MHRFVEVKSKKNCITKHEKTRKWILASIWILVVFHLKTTYQTKGGTDRAKHYLHRLQCRRLVGWMWCPIYCAKIWNYSIELCLVIIVQKKALLALDVMFQSSFLPWIDKKPGDLFFLLDLFAYFETSENINFLK